MNIEGRRMRLDIVGLGIVFYSPSVASHIAEGEDYLALRYTTEKDVQAHIQEGSIVGFGTGSPGRFELWFHCGYPDDTLLRDSEFKLRLGLKCVGGTVCFRDLYDLMDWRAQCPAEQMIQLQDGFYHVTLCSSRPESGVLGDHQVIHVYLEKLDSFPNLAKQGIPTLYSVV